MHAAQQVGWPQYTATVEKVVADLPANQRAHAVIFTYGYSQASALELLGTNLPPIYSGHNAYPYGVGLKSSRPDQLRRRPSIGQRALARALGDRDLGVCSCPTRSARYVVIVLIRPIRTRPGGYWRPSPYASPRAVVSASFPSSTRAPVRIRPNS
jgi:hypothetical protein